MKYDKLEVLLMIIERIKRKIDLGMYIVPQITPIIYFGNYDAAKACTVSLNPSNKEFTDNTDRLLDERNAERLCSRKKLNRADNDELSDDEANTVLKYCTDYFKLRPLKSWFSHIDYFIKEYGNYSYYDGTCVHLDLVQWATYKKWNDVPNSIQRYHLKSDLPVLKYLLNKDFEIIFLNGTTTVKNVRDCLDITLKEKSTVFRNTNGVERKLVIYHGKYNNIEIVGWNIYLQSPAAGGYENKSVLCDIIRKNTL
jgi:hypothetical protein